MGHSLVQKNRVRRMNPILLAFALVLLFVQVACSSSGRGSSGDRATTVSPPPSVSSTQVRRPAEIRTMELASEGGGAALELTADRPLVWTSFRNAVGDLVIELPNSVPGAGVDDLASAQGLIADVDVEMFDDSDRPLTRIVVHTREPSEHSLAGEGESLRLQMLPVEGGGEAVALTYEPLPAEDVDEPAEMAAAQPQTSPRAELTSQEAAMAPPPPTAGTFFGTPEEPLPGPPPTGVAATQLFAVDVLSAGDETRIAISGDGEFRYSTFRLENPERFVIDLSGVINTSARATVPVGAGLVDRIRIGQFRPRPDPISRVVFDLGGSAFPAIERSADGLVVSFSSQAASAPESMLAQSSGSYDSGSYDSGSYDSGSYDSDSHDSSAAGSQMVDSQDQQASGTYDAGETTTYGATASGTADDVEVYDPPAEPEAEEVAEWTDPDPTPSEPRYVVQDSGPSGVAAVPVYEPAPSGGQTTGEALSMAGDPQLAAPPPPRQNLLTRDVAQLEAQSVELEPEVEEVNPVLRSLDTLVVSRQEREYVGEPIDMSLKKADLVETLRSFATISDLNFVIQPGVSGSVTVELKGVPWDQAMEQILKINNLGIDIDGTIVRIAPMAQLRAEAEEQRRLSQARQESVPLRTVLKSLSYSNAADVAGLLRNRTGSIMSNRGTVQIDRRTNTLIIRELPEFVDTVLAVIENLDAPEPQVTIEARIIEATKSFARSLGIAWNFGYDAGPATGNSTGLAFPSNVDVDGSVGLLTGGNNGLLTFGLGNLLNTFNLDAQLQIAENEGLVNLVSAPRVTTLNNTSASIQSGVQIPIQTVANNTVSVQFVNATLQLSVTPQVTAEGTIMLDIQVAKRSPQPGLAITGAGNAPISTREARTKVIVRDGGTAVIGGIYEVSSNQVQDRLPGLANIPILGHLFKNRNRSNSNDELMIFITPRIVQM